MFEIYNMLIMFEIYIISIYKKIEFLYCIFTINMTTDKVAFNDAIHMSAVCHCDSCGDVTLPTNTCVVSWIRWTDTRLTSEKWCNDCVNNRVPEGQHAGNKILWMCSNCLCLTTTPTLYGVNAYQCFEAKCDRCV